MLYFLEDDKIFYELDAIFYVHGMGESVLKIAEVISFLGKIFGLNSAEIQKNLVVILTKWDNMSEDQQEDFFSDGIGKTLINHNIKYVTWVTPKNEKRREKWAGQIKSQAEELSKICESFKTFKLPEMQSIVLNRELNSQISFRLMLISRTGL